MAGGGLRKLPPNLADALNWKRIGLERFPAGYGADADLV